MNRELLIEGNSLLITLNKNQSDDENRFKRINVSKITLIKDIYNKPISNLELRLNSPKQILALNDLEDDGHTSVTFHVKNESSELTFKLKKNRNVDRNSINLLKKEGIITQIN